MPKFRKQYYKAMESAKVVAAKNVFKFTKKASVRKAQDDEKQEKELSHPHWLHDLAFFEWLLDQPTDSGFDAVWDKFKRDWDGFTGDNFPATTHRQGPMVNQFKAVRRGKKRMYMKTTVKEGRLRLAEKSVLPPHVKVIDYLRAKKGLRPRSELPQKAPASLAPLEVSSPPLEVSSPPLEVSSPPLEVSSLASVSPDEGSPVPAPPPALAISNRSIPRTKKKRKQMATPPSFVPNPYQSRGNVFADLS
jgi:hypothetical protein